MKKIFLNKQLVTGTTLTQDGVLAYAALRMVIDESIPLYNKIKSTDCVSVNKLAYLLVGEMDYEKALIDALTRGIIELEKGEWISVRKDLSVNKNYEYVLDLSALWLNTESDKFVTVFDDEIRKIMSCNEVMKKKISMLKYYIALISTFDWSLEGKIGHMSQQYISEQADISSRTSQRYNEILEELQMIYIYKSNDKIRIDDRLKQIKNCYSRYVDKNMCEFYASNYENMYGSQHKRVETQKKKKQADYNRRLAQIYNRIQNGHAENYDEETIRQVYRYIYNKNDFLMKEINRKNVQQHLTYSDETWIAKLQSQIRDVSIFDQFDFLHSESSNIWGKPNLMNVNDIH